MTSASEFDKKKNLSYGHSNIVTGDRAFSFDTDFGQRLLRMQET